VHHRGQFVGEHGLAFLGAEDIIFVMFETDGARAAAAADYAHRDFVATLVLDNKTGEIGVENLATFSLRGRMHYGGGYAGIIIAAFHGDGYARETKGVAIGIEGASSVFDDSEFDFRKSHSEVDSAALVSRGWRFFK